MANAKSRLTCGKESPGYVESRITAQSMLESFTCKRLRLWSVWGKNNKPAIYDSLSSVRIVASLSCCPNDDCIVTA